jgi:hypothetical protein
MSIVTSGIPGMLTFNRKDQEYGGGGSGVYFSYWLIQRLSASHTPSLELPVSVLYISVPIGCLLMILYYIEEFTQKK